MYVCMRHYCVNIAVRLHYYICIVCFIIDVLLLYYFYIYCYITDLSMLFAD